MMSLPDTGWVSFAYDLINPPASGMKAGAGQTFIYVLMFNIPGHPSKPYYVGQAQGLRQRFGNHQMITWHVARFGSAPRVFIAGLVPSAIADHAEQNLIARLARAGYRLTNTMVQRAGRIVRRPTPFLSEPVEATLHHLNTPPPRGSVFLAWQAQFVPVKGNQRPVTGCELHPDEVLSYVEELGYRSPEAKEVSLELARAFDPGFQGTTLDIVHVFRGRHTAKHLKHTLMRLRDLWVFSKGLQAGRAKGYRLTKRHTAAILALRGADPYA